ncbi:MAG: CD3324 family protein [Paenibacillaceae bacterium]
MSYKNGKDVLPPGLLKELQKYIDGELIYVPKCAEQRAGWGEINGTKDMIDRRNHDIYQQYTSGECSIMELIRTHHLSEDSIRKIILKTRNDLRQTVAT